VALVPEPSNEFDPHAVRVDAVTGETFGYIPKDWAAVLVAGEWRATVSAVLANPRTGAPAGLRLALRRHAKVAA